MNMNQRLYKMRSLLLLALALCSSLGLLTIADLGVASTEAQQEPLFLQVLDYLRDNPSAVPSPLPEVHPFRTAYNPEAIIPPQCYTRTEGQFNPCYVCHQNFVEKRENTMNDGELQLSYSFSDVGMTNHWKNLFEDRSERVAAISDDEILTWVDTDNYSALRPRLEAAKFSGWIPDLEGLQEGPQAFDEEGFARDGSQWVAFNYKPLPSTFWPTNGSTDDVMIRLPEPFRTTEDGRYSRDVYQANLAIVEANIKGLDDISVNGLDESQVEVDLDGDGALGVVRRISVLDSFVGAGAGRLLDTYLYPEGTEFLHTVRYLGVSEKGEIQVSTRMKEVRYMRKTVAYRKAAYARHYQLEAFAKEVGQLPQYTYLGDHGLDNGAGWVIHGFIEDRNGELRAVTYEENLFCMGCHTSVGSTIDKTFSFPRKVDGAAGWGYINLRGMPDAPNIGEDEGEIATYLTRVGGGGEFRSNTEMYRKWFDDDGKVDRQRLAMARDVYDLITPSVARALELNKAYKSIVEEQDFLYGRDATLVPPENVYEYIDNETAPVLPANLFFPWDIRLDWDHPSLNSKLSAN